MTKKLAFNPLSGLFWCQPWVRAILTCGCEMANPFAPRSPITMTSQCCAGQDRTGRTSFQRRQSILRMYFVADYLREAICSPNLWKSISRSKLEEFATHRGIVQPDIKRIYDYYRVDAINRRLVMFYFSTRVNVATIH